MHRLWYLVSHTWVAKVKSHSPSFIDFTDNSNTMVAWRFKLGLKAHFILGAGLRAAMNCTKFNQ